MKFDTFSEPTWLGIRRWSLVYLVQRDKCVASMMDGDRSFWGRIAPQCGETYKVRNPVFSRGLVVVGIGTLTHANEFSQPMFRVLLSLLRHTEKGTPIFLSCHSLFPTGNLAGRWWTFSSPALSYGSHSSVKTQLTYLPYQRAGYSPFPAVYPNSVYCNLLYVIMAYPLTVCLVICEVPQ